jgi:transposase-like protein
MPKKRHKPEEIVAKLRQADVLISQGQDIADVIHQIGVSEVTYYRWRQEYGGLKTEQVKRLKELCCPRILRPSEPRDRVGLRRRKATAANEPHAADPRRLTSCEPIGGLCNHRKRCCSCGAPPKKASILAGRNEISHP